jgi:putative two-component system hydrogenase maturation factor HypX/HoxX
VVTLPEELPSTFAKCKLIGSHHEIWYEESADVGYLHFDFHNGAMSTEQCQRLRRAFQLAKALWPTKVIALVGGDDFHSNGIHLTAIEAAHDQAAESWRNINAINDLVLEVLTHEPSDGECGAGATRARVALSRTRLRSRRGARRRIFNPHYKTMGLRGSEYWTYLLPRRIGAEAAHRLTESCLPISAESAFAIGLVDVLIDARGAGFMAQLAACLHDWCEPAKLAGLLQTKREALPDAAVLHQYRLDELAQRCARISTARPTTQRKAFVFKEIPTETPSHLAPHRQRERVEA